MDKLYTKILCPLDFSSYSAEALKKAVRLVSIFDAELLLAHIITYPGSSMYKGKVDVTVPPKEIVKVVEGIVREFAEEHVSNVPYEILVKNLEHSYTGIIECVEENNVDLIVMATRGRTGAKRLFLGSVAESAVRSAPCSVLVVR